MTDALDLVAVERLDDKIGHCEELARRLRPFRGGILSERRIAALASSAGPAGVRLLASDRAMRHAMYWLVLDFLANQSWGQRNAQECRRLERRITMIYDEILTPEQVARLLAEGTP